MKRLITIILATITLFLSQFVSAQSDTVYHFKFKSLSKEQTNQISLLISIDKIKTDTVFAYANSKEFSAFKTLGIAYQFIDNVKGTKAVDMASSLADMANWNKYPTYNLYIEMMNKWLIQYPKLCSLEEIGTLASGRKLLAIKISDNISNNFESEPKLILSSGIHGDETAGYPLMLRLIDYLLANYSVDTSITTLLNNSQIYINPLANPNGTFKGGNHTIGGATRYNANNTDLNRNFPDPAAGNHPDGNVYQEETLFMMEYAKRNKFDMGVNIHAGSELVNYPWDTWVNTCADDPWWKYIGANYRDSAQANSPAGYFTDVSNGLSNGYAWYRITGGRQDYMNYFHETREFTLEISSSKMYAASELPNLWKYNKAALLGFLSESQNGIHGTITNTKGKPLKAKIEAQNHDKTNSEICSDSTTGFFARYLKEGEYTLKISANGYVDYIIKDLNVQDGKQTVIKPILHEPYSNLCTPKIISQQFYNVDQDSINIPIINSGNETQLVKVRIKTLNAANWLTLNSDTVSIAPRKQQNISFYAKQIPSKDTSIQLTAEITADKVYEVILNCTFKTNKNLVIEHIKPIYKLAINSIIVDSILIVNPNSFHQNILFSKPSHSSLKLSSNINIITANDSLWIPFTIDASNMSAGIVQAFVLINNQKIEFNISALLQAKLQISIEKVYFLVQKNNEQTQTLLLSNTGIKTVPFSVSLEDTSLKNSIEITPIEDSIYATETQLIEINVKSNNLALGVYQTNLVIASNNDTLITPIHIKIDSLPLLHVRQDTIKIICESGSKIRDSIKVSNNGGSFLKLSLNVDKVEIPNYIILPNKTNPIPAKQTDYVPFVIDCTKLTSGEFNNSVTINGFKVPLCIQVINEQKLIVHTQSIHKKLSLNQTLTDTLIIENIGEKSMPISITTMNNSNWISVNSPKHEIAPYESVALTVTLNATNLQVGTYTDKLSIIGGKEIRIPIQIILEDNQAN